MLSTWKPLILTAWPRFLAPSETHGYLCLVPLNLTTSTLPWSEHEADCLALVCDESAFLASPAIGLVAEIDEALGGALLSLAASERFKGKKNQTLTFPTFGRLRAQRLVLLGVGPAADLTPNDLRPAAARAVRAANGFGAHAVSLLLPSGLQTQEHAAASVQAAAEGAWLGTYRFDKYLSEDKRTPVTVTDVQIALPATPVDADLAPALARGRNTALAICQARDLVNEPAVAMTPTLLAAAADALAKDCGLSIKVLGPEACRDENMGLFLAVAQGSDEPPRFVHLAYTPPQPKKRVVIVGKGVTFDSGGLSLKPNDGMLDMKVDMAGAAAVIAAIGAVAREKLPIEVHALAACTENMPSGSAYRLGDVLRSKAGKTVEINNTDAEGRLTLADAITYGLALEPDQLFDFATLTGACMVALGPHIAGVMTNDEGLGQDWLAAARQAGEEMWRLPLPERLNDMLRSEIADMKNTGERWGGALTAGLFLKSFVGNTPWVHVDIAGPATADKEAGHVSKGGTGFAVATILAHLRRLAAA